MHKVLYLVFFVLVVSTTVSQSSSIPLNYTLVSNETILVPANVQWTNSSVYIKKGDYLILKGYGKWRYDPRPQFETGPNGLMNDNQLQLGALVGKISNVNEVFKVGSQWEGYVNNEGWLFLGMYDTTPYDNNLGQMSVLISVYRISNIDSDMLEANEHKSTELNTVNTVESSKSHDQPAIPGEQACISIILFIGLTAYAYVIIRSNT